MQITQHIISASCSSLSVITTGLFANFYAHAGAIERAEQARKRDDSDAAEVDDAQKKSYL